MNKIAQKLRRRGGMTLVELIAAALIISLAALMMVSSFSLAMRLMIRGKDHENAMSGSYQSVDTGQGDRVPGTITFTVNGQQVEIEGYWVTTTIIQGDSEVRMTVFEANRPEARR
ncbi:MAG: hypothetical protein FWD39_02300 [Clostridiales bacterium]|nr:hypothetical protein [Clostridiales bacterium]